MSERLPCPIRGCDHTRPPEHAFCWQHWRAVPEPLRKAVIAGWNERRRTKACLDVRLRSHRGVERGDPLRKAYSAAMRRHLQALEDAAAAVESRGSRDLFANLSARS